MSDALPIPFNGGQSSGIEELAGASPFSVNMLVDAAGALYTRPGLSTWSEWADAVPDALSTGPVIGGAIWGDYLIYVTQDDTVSPPLRRLWAMVGPNHRIALTDDTDVTTQLDGTARPTFAATKSRVVVAGGGVPQKWEGSGLSARLGGSPPDATHVIANARRLLLSNPTIAGAFYWSPPGETEHETWNSGDSGSAEAEARPDAIQALIENSNEIFAFGQTTTQIFQPDPSLVYATGRASNFGTEAPYAIARIDESFVMLDDQRRIVITDGRTMNPLSEPGMARTIDRFATVSDAWVFRAKLDGWDLAVFVFPTEGRTLVFDSQTKQWSEWRSRRGDVNAPWLGTCHVHWPSKNIDLIGTRDGRFLVLDPDAFEDDGEPLVGTVRTGFGSRGKKALKVCERLGLTMRRGENGLATEPQVLVQWRDKLGTFCSPLRYGLGANGDPEATVFKWTLGTYRQRQWQMTFSANARFILSSAEETFSETAS